MKTPPLSKGTILVLSCISEDEKSVLQVYKSSRLTVKTVRRILKQLVRDGVAERRPDTGRNKCTHYLYRKSQTTPVASSTQWQRQFIR
jgi:DNA-binding IclR family transcriptional regulator